MTAFSLAIAPGAAVAGGARAVTADGRPIVVFARGYERLGARAWFDDELPSRFAEGIRGSSFDHVARNCNGLFFVLSVESHADGSHDVSIATDRFGGRALYFAIFSDVLHLSDDAVALAQAVRAGANVPAALGLLAMEFVPGEATIAQGVKEIGAAIIARFRVERGATREVERRCYWQQRVRVDSGPPGFFDSIARGIESALRAEVAPNWSEIFRARGLTPLVPLSGGLDSRLLLSAFHCDAVSYGADGSEDVQVARRAATAIGTKHRLATFDEHALDPSARFELARAIGVTTRLTLADGGRLLARNFGSGAVFLPGHSGDGISGSKIDASLAKCGNPEDVEAKIARSYWCCFTDEAAQRLPRGGPEAWREARGLLRAAVAANAGDNAFESMQRWTMRELVRRRVLPELELYRRSGSLAVLPFFDYTFASVLEDTPVSALLHQSAYRVAARRLLDPKLLSIALQGRGPLTAPGPSAPPMRDSSFPRRARMRLLRMINPVAYELRHSATPMFALWQSRHAWREAVLRDLRAAEPLWELLHRDATMAYLDARLGRDYHLTTLGVWGLVTVGLALGAVRGNEPAPAR